MAFRELYPALRRFAAAVSTRASASCTRSSGSTCVRASRLRKTLRDQLAADAEAASERDPDDRTGPTKGEHDDG